MAFDGIHGHIDDRRNVGQIQILLKSQRDDDARMRRQFGDELAQQCIKHRVSHPLHRGGLVDIVHRHFAAQTGF